MGWHRREGRLGGGQNRAQSHCVPLDSWWVFEEKKAGVGGSEMGLVGIQRAGNKPASLLFLTTLPSPIYPPPPQSPAEEKAPLPPFPVAF